MSDMRNKLVEAVDRVRRQETQQQLSEMTDAQLDAFLASGLGLPLGTTFTDEQLEMIANYSEGSQL